MRQRRKCKAFTFKYRDRIPYDNCIKYLQKLIELKLTKIKNSFQKSFIYSKLI